MSIPMQQAGALRDHPGVVIVGAGIAGLAAAYELERLGAPFTLLEAGSRAGGVVLSERVDDFVIDAGPDSLLVQKPDGIILCEELGLGERLVPTTPPRLSYVQRAGRLYPLPAFSVLGIPTRLGPFLQTPLFSWSGKLRMGAELVVPARRDDEDESIGSFMTRRFGREANTYLAEPLLAGIHAGDVNRLSVQALFPRFVDAERRHGSLIRAFRSQRPSSASAEGPFRSLPGGLGELVDALVSRLPAGQLLRGSSAVRVTRIAAAGPSLSNDPAEGDLQVERMAGEPVAGRAVILATPAFVTARLVRELSPDLSRLCGEVPYASTATIAFAFERSHVRHPLNGSGFVVPRVEPSGLLAASWLSSKWPGRAPANMVLLRAFAGGARDPEAIERSDEELIASSLEALGPLLGITGAPRLTRVYRWNRANAQHEVGHLARLATIERLLRQIPGLFLTGSGFRGVGLPDCIADGRATARLAASLLTRSGAVRA